MIAGEGGRTGLRRREEAWQQGWKKMGEWLQQVRRGQGFAAPGEGFATGRRRGDGCSGVTAGEIAGGSWRQCRDALEATTSSPPMQMEKEGCKCFYILQNNVVLIL